MTLYADSVTLLWPPLGKQMINLFCPLNIPLTCFKYPFLTISQSFSRAPDNELLQITVSSHSCLGWKANYFFSCKKKQSKQSLQKRTTSSPLLCVAAYPYINEWWILSSAINSDATCRHGAEERWRAETSVAVDPVIESSAQTSCSFLQPQCHTLGLKLKQADLHIACNIKKVPLTPWNLSSNSQGCQHSVWWHGWPGLHICV